MPAMTAQDPRRWPEPPEASADAAEDRTAREVLHDVNNAATIKGTVAILAGLAVVVLPAASARLLVAAVAVGITVSGLLDLWQVTGARRRKASVRAPVLVALRGLAAIVIGVWALLNPTPSFALVMFFGGLYLVVRGAFNVVRALVGVRSGQMTQRLTFGSASIALGLLALAVPESLAEGLVVTGGVAAAVLGGVMLVYGLRSGGPTDQQSIDVEKASVGEVLWDWTRQADVGPRRREEIADGLYFEEPSKIDKYVAWWVMLILSSSIATFAVLQDSTAVVIGAMLVAPLMTPILGLAAALVNGWRTRALSSALLVIMGVTAAIGLSVLLARWVPALVSFDSNSQISSRVTPTFIDMLVALAAGAAGAFATVNVRVANSIAGVAIAVALVPPLSVVGIALEAGRFSDASGAFLLFMTNFVSIVLAAALVFVLNGLAAADRLRRQRRQVLSTLAPFGAIALVVLVPLVFTVEGILVTSTEQRAAQDVVTEWLGEDSELQLDSVTVEGRVVEVYLGGPVRPPSPRALQTALTEALERPVEVVLELTPRTVVELDTDGTQTETGTPPTEP